MTSTIAGNQAPISDDDADTVAYYLSTVLDNVEQVIQGKRAEVRLALTCLLAGGHLLIEDNPGVGKTTLAKALAQSVQATWGRIQFTPDLLPTDVTGVSVWNQEARQFEFRPGAVFANLVVADEINRASPKTQSALLEVMEERQVTVDGATRQVPQPFMVIATQNPVDMEGTYRLPEAQLDRFLLRIRLGYPDEVAEQDLLNRRVSGGLTGEVSPVVTLEGIRQMAGLAGRVAVDPAITSYVVAVAAATRSRPELRLGTSPRGCLAWLRAAQAWAVGDGRTYVVPDDVKHMAAAVMAHRLLPTPEAEIRGTQPGQVPDQVLDEVLASVPVPRGRLR